MGLFCSRDRGLENRLIFHSKSRLVNSFMNNQRVKWLISNYQFTSYINSLYSRLNANPADINY